MLMRVALAVATVPVALAQQPRTGELVAPWEDSVPEGCSAASFPIEEAKLIAGDPATDDWFGISVAVSGDTAVVGSVQDSHAGGANAGSAYVFVRSGTGWSQQQKLIASDAAPADGFGMAVDISGDTIVVGAMGDNHAGGVDAGSAYVFVRSGSAWTEEAKLIASDAESADLFGSSVALSGDTVVVGAPWADPGGLAKAGSVTVFVRSGTGWSEQQKLTAFDASAGDNLGEAVELSGDTALIGALGDDHEPLTDAGSAYAFVRSGNVWSLQQKLTASDAEAIDRLGGSLALSGERALIGAFGDSHSGFEVCGSAYVFLRSGTSWGEEAKLIAGDAQTEDWFGTSVALSGSTAIVGAPGDDSARGLLDAGSAYVFRREEAGWSEQGKLIAADGDTLDSLGISVALSGFRIVAGAYFDDHPGGDDQGSAYVFLNSSAAVNYCTAGTSASGCQAILSASGTPSASAASGFVLETTSAEGQKDGLFFWGTNGGQANPWGNGTSFQCVVPPLTRGSLLAGGGTLGACDGALAQDLNALWCPSCPKPQKNPGSGALLQAQLWYRDPLNTSNQSTSLSDAVQLCVAP